MKTAIIVIQVASAIIVIASVLLQQKGTGLSGVFGGSGYYQTRRGAEKFVFYATIVAATAFFLATLWQIFAK